PRRPRGAHGSKHRAAPHGDRTSRRRAARPPGRSPALRSAGPRSAAAAKVARQGRARRRSSWRQYGHSAEEPKFLGELREEIVFGLDVVARTQWNDDADAASSDEAEPP